MAAAPKFQFVPPAAAAGQQQPTAGGDASERIVSSNEDDFILPRSGETSPTLASALSRRAAAAAAADSQTASASSSSAYTTSAAQLSALNPRPLQSSSSSSSITGGATPMMMPPAGHSRRGSGASTPTTTTGGVPSHLGSTALGGLSRPSSSTNIQLLESKQRLAAAAMGAPTDSPKLASFRAAPPAGARQPTIAALPYPNTGGTTSKSLLGASASSPSLNTADRAGAAPSPLPMMYAYSPSMQRPLNGHEREVSSFTMPEKANAPLLDDSHDSAPASSYYEQYEATVNRIRARRTKHANEALEAASAGNLRSSDRTKRELRTVGLLFSVVLALVTLIVYFLYPRVPLWTVASVNIDSLRLWSDGTADFALSTNFDVANANFLSTCVDSIALDVSHNGTHLGSSMLIDLKLGARHTSQLTFANDFSPVDPLTFATLFAELARDAGELTLDYSLAIVTSENFRLRNIQVACTTVLQLDPVHVPPTTQVVTNECTHTEQTG